MRACTRWKAGWSAASAASRAGRPCRSSRPSSSTRNSPSKARARPGATGAASARRRALLKRIVNDPARYEYSDLATRPLNHNELAALDLFHETRGGEEAVEKQARQEALLESVRAAHEEAA